MQLMEEISDESAIVQRHSVQVLIWIYPPLFDKLCIGNLLSGGKPLVHLPPDIDGYVFDMNRDTIQLSDLNFKRQFIGLVVNMYQRAYWS